MKQPLALIVLAILAVAARSAAGITLREYELGWARYYAEKDGVPLALVEAIIVVESAGNPYAVSARGAAGVMQLMPETARKFHVRNRFLVQENIRGGVAYLASLVRKFHGDLRLAVAAYYAGERLIERRKLACSQTQVYTYVCRVAAVYRSFEAKWR